MPNKVHAHWDTPADLQEILAGAHMLCGPTLNYEEDFPQCITLSYLHSPPCVGESQ